MTPTQRSLKYLRAHGDTVAVVERWNSFAKIRQDLFGAFDLVSLGNCGEAGGRIIGVQVTSGSHVAARVEKLRALPAVARWLGCGGRVVVHGWRQVGARGKRKTWECREVWL